MATPAMDNVDAAAAMKRLIIECELPRTDMSLFGILCPYCGKTDRIRQLERPPELEGVLSGADFEVYNSAWSILAPNGADLGVCRFCLNPLRLNVDRGLAEPPCEVWD